MAEEDVVQAKITRYQIQFQVGYARILNDGLIPGGIEGDVIVKQSSAENDAEWTNVLDAGGY